MFEKWFVDMLVVMGILFDVVCYEFFVFCDDVCVWLYICSVVYFDCVVILVCYVLVLIDVCGVFVCFVV